MRGLNTGEKIEKSKHGSTKGKDTDRWVVATDKDLEEARSKGLYKGLSSLPTKKSLELSPIHVYELFWMVGDAIEKRVFEWFSAGGEAGYDIDQYYRGLENLLYILEDLIPYSIFGKEGHFVSGDSELFRKLNLIRYIISFPPKLNDYYLAYLKNEDEYYLKSHICNLCGKRGTGVFEGESELHVHQECLIKRGFYQCEHCGWLYPNNNKRCERKRGCGKKALAKCKPLFGGT